MSKKCELSIWIELKQKKKNISEEDTRIVKDKNPCDKNACHTKMISRSAEHFMMTTEYQVEINRNCVRERADTDMTKWK